MIKTWALRGPQSGVKSGNSSLFAMTTQQHACATKAP